MGGCWENEISVVITTDNLQNHGENQFYRKWNTDGNIQRTGMLVHFGRWLQQYSISLSAVHIFLSFTAFLGNALILVALHKESSLHPPSKLLYRCLATTDLFVGLVFHPLSATYRMSIVHEDWSLCRYVYDAVTITAHALCSVSLLTSTAISVDRLLALLLALRYRQVVNLKRTYMIVATFWVVSGVAALCYILDHRITFWCGYMYIGVPSCPVISIASYAKIFCTLSHHHNQVQGNRSNQMH